MLNIKSIFALALIAATVSACGGQELEGADDGADEQLESAEDEIASRVRVPRSMSITYSSPGFYHLWFQGYGFPRDGWVLVDLYESSYNAGTSSWTSGIVQQTYVRADATGFLTSFFDIGTRDCQRNFWVRGLEVNTGIYSSWSAVSSFTRTCVN